MKYLINLFENKNEVVCLCMDSIVPFLNVEIVHMLYVASESHSVASVKHPNLLEIYYLSPLIGSPVDVNNLEQ